MASAPRYDVVIVGGGLAGIAVATLLAKRSQRVALVEPRPEWGGCFADQHLGGHTISLGPRAVVSHERLGWADAYFEAIGLSLALLIREGTTFKREPLQLLWDTRRLTLFPNRAEFAEELRREYRVGDPDVAALLADLDAVYDALALRMDPSPFADTKASLARLRGVATARTFAARFGTLAPSEYVRARGLADAFAAYFAAWRSALAVDDEPSGTWLFRTALAHRGFVSLPGGRAVVCRLLASRFQALGGEVLRTPVVGIGPGQEPFVETDGRRLTARTVIINATRPPGTPTRDRGHIAITASAFTVPSACLPEAMATYLLVGDGTDTWSLARRRQEGTAGAAAHTLVVGSYRGRVAGWDAARISEEVGALLPFAVGQLDFAGTVRGDEIPDPVDHKLMESVTWRVRRSDWVQAGRAPVWWLPDDSVPWLSDAREYRAALAVDRAVRQV